MIGVRVTQLPAAVVANVWCQGRPEGPPEILDSGERLSIFLYENKFAKPHDSVELEDESETWHKLLDDPDVVPEEDDAPDGKEAASALCGARYFDDVTTRDKENVNSVETLVLDVDSGDTVPAEGALRASLNGLRAVIYTSPSHTTASPRWRVLLPLRTGVPAKKHRALVAWLALNLVPAHPGCISVEQTGDPCRLGFVGITKHPEDYTWWEQKGVQFDWTSIPLEEETWLAAPLGGLERSPLWTDRPTALKSALKSYASVGQGMGKGGGRSVAIWKAADHLWWAWAAEDEDFVMTVLRAINTNFRDPEDEDELIRQMTEAHKRVIGEKRKSQNSGTYGWAREPTNFISHATIAAYARRLRGRKSPEDVLVGEALRNLAKGTESLSVDPDTWRGLINKCAQALARGFPTESAERIALQFRPTLATMRMAGATLPTEEEICNIVQTRLDGARKAREENYTRIDAEIREKIEYATAGERSGKYTKEEVETWQQPGVGLCDHNWILVSRRALFVFKNGTWVGPYTKEEFEAQGYIDLAAASDFVKLRTFNADGVAKVTPLKTLVTEYGSRCTTRVDLNCEKTWFNEAEHQLVLSGPPRRELQPRFHEEVDQWIRIMTGRNEALPGTVTEDVDGNMRGGVFTSPPNMKARQAEAAGLTGPGGGPVKRGVAASDDYDAVCDWLACITQLDHPCAALYLQGKRSTGKGLFAEGVGRIWKTGPLSIDRAFDRFNAMLLETPFIWVDEKLPGSMQASVLLRQALAAREFIYERKHVDAGKLTGCLRMLFTANNMELFNKTKERVQKDDMDALALRFVHIHVRPEADAYLHSIAPRHEGFVERNMLAEHALWLQEKRWEQIKALRNRFLVVGRTTNVSDAVTTDVPETQHCCETICTAVLNAVGFDTGIANGVANASGFGVGTAWWAVKGGELLVHANALKQYLTGPMSKYSYTTTEITRAVSTISSGDSKTVHVKEKSLRMRPIRLQALYTWCDIHKVYDKVDVQNAIDKLSKDMKAYEKAAEERAAAASVAATASAAQALGKAVADVKKSVN